MDETNMDQNTNEQQQRPVSAGMTEDIRGVMTDIERRLDRLRVAHADREREREELEARSTAVEQQAQELEAAATELADRQREHEQAVAAAEARFTELDQREVQAREAFEKAKAEHDAVRTELAEQRETLETQQAEFEAEKARTRELAEDAGQQLKDVEEDRAALEATAREIDERQQDLDDQASTLAERVREIDQQRVALDARAEQLTQQDQKLADLSRQAAEQREKLSGDSSDLEQQKQWLAEQTKQADVLRARVKQLENELEAAKEQVAEATQTQVASAEIDEAVAEELEQTRGKLRDAAAMIAKLREQLDQSGSDDHATSASADGEHIRRRQRRLRFVRQTLQQEHAKIAKASELMRQRAANMAQQGTVSDGAQSESKPVATGPMAAIARMGVGMAGVAVALAVLAGVSWIAAGEIATPTYAASVTVAHDARGREVLAEDLAGWQAFHESLMSDPRFYEFAADRMRQRGLLELGDAVSVKAFVENSVSWESGRDGELMIEVREQGAGRARRVAETLAISLAGQANTARERRPDGLPSVISKEATPDDRPLTNEQPMLAGGVFVGLALVIAALGGVVSRRVKRVSEQAAAEGHAAVDDMGVQHEGRINIG